MEELIALIKELKVTTANWNAKCKKRFYFSSITLPGYRANYQRHGDGLVGILSRIESLVDSLLITSEGRSNVTNEILLEESTGVKIITLEEDSFGPLMKGICVGHGVITYG